jgi:hypothetical protein
MTRLLKRRRFHGHPRPQRIRFHGQEVEFSPALRYLLADETAVSVLGEPAQGHGPDKAATEWQRAIATVLDLFDDAGRGSEAYEWLVTPWSKLNDRRPLDLIEHGRGSEVIRQVEHLLSFSP